MHRHPAISASPHPLPSRYSRHHRPIQRVRLTPVWGPSVGISIIIIILIISISIIIIV
jgi:hypothetical protein